MPNDEETKLATSAQEAARDGAVDVVKSAHGAGLVASYTVQPGDTYESIATALYGSKDGADDIHAWNQASGAVSTDPRILDAGTVLTIPQPPAADAEPGAPAGVGTKAGDQDPEAPAAGTGVTGQPVVAHLSDDELRAELERRNAAHPA